MARLKKAPPASASAAEAELRSGIAEYGLMRVAQACGLRPRILCAIAYGRRQPTLLEAIVLHKALDIHILTWVG